MQVPVSVFWVKIAAPEPLKSVPSNFVEGKGSKLFTIQYPNSKLFKNDENHKRIHKILYFFKTNRLVSRDTFPLIRTRCSFFLPEPILL